MRLKNYLNEMGSELDLEAGFTISKKVFKKMKRKYKTFDAFISHLETKANSLHMPLTKQDRYHIKGAFDSV